MVLFHLSEFVSNKNNCVHCIMDKCSNKEHKKDIHMKCITKYVNNPLMIDDLKRSIENCNIVIHDFNNENILKNGFMYTTCLFCLSKKSNGYKCKNVKEGRFGTCKLNNGTIVTYCYPELKNVKHRIQIGLHVDLFINEKNEVKYEFLGSSKEEEVKEKKVISYKEIVKNNSKEEIVSKEVCIEKSSEDKNEYKDLYEKLYKEYETILDENRKLQNIYKTNHYPQNQVNSDNKHILLENISLKAHIDYLQMKMKNMYIEKKDLFMNILNEDIQHSWNDL